LASGADDAVFARWMVEIFDGRPTPPVPVAAFPPSGRFEAMAWEWPEGC
jgi:hypothetical protein